MMRESGERKNRKRGRQRGRRGGEGSVGASVARRGRGVHSFIKEDRQRSKEGKSPTLKKKRRKKGEKAN